MANTPNTANTANMTNATNQQQLTSYVERGGSMGEAIQHWVRTHPKQKDIESIAQKANEQISDLEEQKKPITHELFRMQLAVQRNQRRKEKCRNKSNSEKWTEKMNAYNALVQQQKDITEKARGEINIFLKEIHEDVQSVLMECLNMEKNDEGELQEVSDTGEHQHGTDHECACCN